jgi:hypothetical protein
MLVGHQDRLELLHKLELVLEHKLELVEEEQVCKLELVGQGQVCKLVLEERTEERRWPQPEGRREQQSTGKIMLFFR